MNKDGSIQIYRVSVVDVTFPFFLDSIVRRTFKIDGAQCPKSFIQKIQMKTCLSFIQTTLK